MLVRKIVYSKTAKMIVTKVGNNTFYGEISKELQQVQPESSLKIRLRHLAQIISKIGYVGAALVFIFHIFSVVFIQNNFDFNLIKDTITNIPYISGEILYGLTLYVTVIVIAVLDDCRRKGLREEIRVNKLSLRKTVNYCFLFFLLA